MAGRMLKGLDLRETGSGNLGTTNVFRTLGIAPALAVLVADMGKGALAAFIGLSVLPELNSSLPDLAGLLCTLGAVLGHSYSPFVGFSGGKGVATGAGAFLVLAPLPTVAVVLVWVILLASTRVMSVASVAGAAVLPVSLGLVELMRPEEDARRWSTLIFGTLVSVWVIWRHRGNLQRLRDGKESRLW
jgi:glycerol-3-phosphate acyltransferase PlsY